MKKGRRFVVAVFYIIIVKLIFISILSFSLSEDRYEKKIRNKKNIKTQILKKISDGL